MVPLHIHSQVSWPGKGRVKVCGSAAARPRAHGRLWHRYRSLDTNHAGHIQCQGHHALPALLSVLSNVTDSNFLAKNGAMSVSSLATVTIVTKLDNLGSQLKRASFTSRQLGALAPSPLPPLPRSQGRPGLGRRLPGPPAPPRPGTRPPGTRPLPPRPPPPVHGSPWE